MTPDKEVDEVAELGSLPLFRPVGDRASGRPGRARSGFTLRLEHVHGSGSAAAGNDRAAKPLGVVAEPPAGWVGAGTGRVNWAQVALFRSEASDRLGSALAADPGLDRDGQRELGRSIILDLLEAEAAAALSAGLESTPAADQQATATAVFDALFGLGRLQPLVDDDRVENISINGYDNVRLELTDGSIIPSRPGGRQ